MRNAVAKVFILMQTAIQTIDSLFPKTALHSVAQNELILSLLNQANVSKVKYIFIEVLEWNHLRKITTLKTLDNGTEHTEERKHILQICSHITADFTTLQLSQLEGINSSGLSEALFRESTVLALRSISS